MRDKVTTELQGMLAADLIEPIDASPWVIKSCDCAKNGLGACVSALTFVGPNKAVVPDKYPLPTIEELTTLLWLLRVHKAGS